MNLKGTLKENRLAVIAGIAGGIGGFLYWRFIGCLSGTCVIRSVWYWSTLWGAAVGYLAGDMFNDFLLKRKNKAKDK